MEAVLQQVVPVAIVIPWFSGMIVLYFRFRAKQREYLRQFPPVDGIPLDMYVGGGPPSVRHAILGLMGQHQDSRRLELLRGEMWRRFRVLAIWTIGFPLLAFGIVALLVLIGYLR